MGPENTQFVLKAKCVYSHARLCRLFFCAGEIITELPSSFVKMYC